jgi:hypothetical protein
MSQLLLSSMFGRISKEENQSYIEKDAEVDRLEHKDKKKPCDIIKKPIGRPKKIRRLEMSLVSNISPILQPSSSGSKARVRGPYTNWFTHELWPPIEAAMKQHKNHTLALKYLRIAHRTKGTSTGSYDKLSRGSLNEWFTTSGEIRGHVSVYVAREHAFVPQGQHMPPLQSHMEVTTELVELLLSMREASVSLHAGIVQPIIIGFLQEKAPEVLQKLKVSLNWTRRFMRSRFNWRFRKPTTTKGKLPTDWVNQGHMMTLRIAYLVKLYNIPLSLVVNTDKKTYIWYH